MSKIHYLCFSSGILKKGGKSVWEDQKDYIHLADTGSVSPKMRKRIKLTLSFWNIPGTGRSYARRRMYLRRLPTGIRTAIKDVANCEPVTEASINALTSFCWPVLNELTVCLRSIMRGIRIRLQPKLWRVSLRTSCLHGETKGRILWNLLWSAFRPITPETGLAGAVMKMVRVV